MKSFARVVSFIVVSYILLSILIGIFQVFTDDSYKDTEEYHETVKEYTQSDSLGVTHARAWLDQDYNSEYGLSYSFDNSLSNECYNNRSGFEPGYKSHWQYEDYWGAVYSFLVKHDSSALHKINDSLYQVGNQRYLDRREFANMLVSFVQDIPYNYIIPNECTSEHSDNPCVGFQKFGILSPIEFLYSLNGDCDTRTTLLYSILTHFGYKTVVLISKEYAHAMLGVNIPSTGDYIRHKGHKFYFWETTNVGWKSGNIPGGMDNKNYWKIALDYEH